MVFMRFKNRAFALIWIILSAVLCCGMFAQYEKNISDTSGQAVVSLSAEPINQEKLSVFLLVIALLSLSMGVFFFAFSDELKTYIGNYKRTKEI